MFALPILKCIISFTGNDFPIPKINEYKVVYKILIYGKIIPLM